MINYKENYKNVVLFREKKRKEYLKGKLPKDQHFIIEYWDREIYPNILYRDEPLATDVRLKLMGLHIPKHL